jgi:hypothetical protein
LRYRGTLERIKFAVGLIQASRFKDVMWRRRARYFKNESVGVARRSPSKEGRKDGGGGDRGGGAEEVLEVNKQVRLGFSGKKIRVSMSVGTLGRSG